MHLPTTPNNPNREPDRVLTAQRLLDPEVAAPDVLAHEAFLARARTEHDRGRDAEARIALAAYATARLLDTVLTGNGMAVADATGVQTASAASAAASSVRRRLAGFPVDSPEPAHLRGLLDAMAERPVERRMQALRTSLIGYSYYLREEGRLEEGLDVLGLVARTWQGEVPASEFGSLALSAAWLNRLLARWEEADAAYKAAEEAGRESGDRAVMLLGRLGQGAVLRGQGNLPASEKITQEVIARADTDDVQHVRAGAYANLGVTYMLMERRVDALVATYEAFVQTTDPMQRMRVLSDLGIGLADIGAADVARLAFQIVLTSSASTLLRMNARLELMALAAASGNRVAFEQHRQAARDFAAQMPPSMACDYRYKAGRGLASFGYPGRARALWLEAIGIAESHGLNEWYFRLERALHEVEPGVEPPAAEVPAAPATADAEWESAITRVATGLEEYAAAASADRY